MPALLLCIIVHRSYGTQYSRAIHAVRGISL